MRRGLDVPLHHLLTRLRRLFLLLHDEVRQDADLFHVVRDLPQELLVDALGLILGLVLGDFAPVLFNLRRAQSQEILRVFHASKSLRTLEDDIPGFLCEDE